MALAKRSRNRQSVALLADGRRIAPFESRAWQAKAWNVVRESPQIAAAGVISSFSPLLYLARAKGGMAGWGCTLEGNLGPSDGV
jgi:hypothetical protein